MNYLKLFLLIGILGLSIPLSSQSVNKINRASHLKKYTNNFLDNVPLKLNYFVAEIEQSGIMHIKEPLVTSENDILNALELSSDITFMVRDSMKSTFENKGIYRRHFQYFKGIKVENGGFTSYLVENRIKRFIPKIKYHINMNTTPNVSEKDLKIILSTQEINEFELIITDKFEDEYNLVYKAAFDDKGSHSIAYIDAHSGVILHKRIAFKFKNAPTEAYGIKNMNDLTIGNTTKLITPDGYLATYDFSNINLYTPSLFFDFDDSKIIESNANESWSTAHAPSSIFQAHFIANLALAEYAELGISFLLVRIGANCQDFVTSGENVPNAIWIESLFLPNSAFLKFSKAGNSTLATDDIIGHELCHAYLSNFIDQFNFAAAGIAEGICDIFGVYIDSKISGLDWQIGNDVPWNIRDLGNPQFSCYSQIINLEDEHLRGMPLGHWFYKLVNGDANNGIISLKMKDVIKIIIDALPNVSEEVDYPELRTATLKAAKDRFGKCSVEYQSLVAAWDFICVTGSSEICCTTQNDITISKKTTISETEYFGGNIYVESGAELYMNNSIFHFYPGKGIIVKNGGRLILQGTTINVCNPSQSWAGIKIESGGFFDTDDTNLLNVANGIDAKANSTIEIYNLTINGKGTTSGKGINLEGKVNNDFINNIYIKDFQYGVYAYNGNSYYGITKGEIKNVQYGIFLSASPAVISGIEMRNVDYGIWCMSSPGSMFLDNTIYQYNSGILSYLSQNTRIENNYLSQPKTTGNAGVFMFLSPLSYVQDNPRIEGNTIGISTWASSGVIARNAVEVTGNNNSTGGGILNLHSSGSYIIDNYVYAQSSSFGIETNSCNGTEIKNNESAVFSFASNVRSAAIRSTGDVGAIIEDNRAEGIDNATGILIQNAGMNTIKCNDVISPDEGLGIYIASDEQGIIGNELTGNQDLTIRSIVGIQDHTGNKFYGGNATAIGLTIDDFDKSKFKVNGAVPYQMPANPDPGNDQWFKSELGTDYQCSGASGPGWTPFQGGDPTKLCQYWLYLKSIKNSKPELFFVKLYHLLKYAESRPSFQIPICIKLDPVFQTLCGITKLVGINDALSKIGKNSVNISNLNAYQENYLLQTSELGKLAAKNQLQSEMETIKPQLDANAVADNYILDSIKNELNLINCTQVIVMKWREIMKLYVDFLKSREVPSQNRAATLSYSSDCADIYGDMIHLARAMANTFDQTNFEAYDNCNDGSTPRFKTVDTGDFTAHVFPNPSSGFVNIQISSGFSGKINITSLDGKLIQSKNVKDSYFEMIDLNNKAGVYFIELSSNFGYKSTLKVIIIE